MNPSPLQALRSFAIRVEAWWFDRTRGVKTSGYLPLDQLTIVGERKSGFEYLPTRPSVVRSLLRQLPIENYSAYTFVDLGSGMGRVLLIAAEYPFQKVVGVEFALELHRRAQDNISRSADSGRKCREVESMNSDVRDFTFPPGDLVIFLFNPFGAELTQQVFARLEASLQKSPRHAIVAMVNPESGHVADVTPFLKLHSETRRYRIYQTT